jgi:hypothetical protein
MEMKVLEKRATLSRDMWEAYGKQHTKVTGK